MESEDITKCIQKTILQKNLINLQLVLRLLGNLRLVLKIQVHFYYGQYLIICKAKCIFMTRTLKEFTLLIYHRYKWWLLNIFWSDDGLTGQGQDVQEPRHGLVGAVHCWAVCWNVQSPVRKCGKPTFWKVARGRVCRQFHATGISNQMSSL
jgi:hypothetical protein